MNPSKFLFGLCVFLSHPFFFISVPWYLKLILTFSHHEKFFQMRFPFHLIIVPWNKWVITDDYDLDCPPRSSVPDSEEKPPLTHPHTPLWIYSLGGRGRHTMEQWPQFEIIYKERLEWVLHITRCVLSCSVMSDSATLWTVSCQAPLSMGILQARILEWVAIPYSRRSSQPRDKPRSPTWQADSP